MCENNVVMSAFLNHEHNVVTSAFFNQESNVVMTAFLIIFKPFKSVLFLEKKFMLKTLLMGQNFDFLVKKDMIRLKNCLSANISAGCTCADAAMLIVRYKQTDSKRNVFTYNQK